MKNHPTDLRIVFLGTPKLAQIVLENLIDSPYKPELVITGPDKKIGRDQKIQPTPVKQTAQKNHIATSNQLPTTSYKFDLAILVAYGHIIPKEILAIPKYGFVNVHPSLLPKYRGPSPIQSAILSDDKKTGVTIIKLDDKVDHGPILAQKEIEIEKDDTCTSLIEKLGNIGAGLLLEVLPPFLAHLRGVKSFHLGGVLKDAKVFLPPKSQYHSEASFTKKISKSDGEIDLENPPSLPKLDRMIRAFYPWPGTWCRLMVNGKWKIVKFLPNPNYPSTKPSNHLSNFLIQPEGKKPMTIEEFLNGYPNFASKLTSSLH